MTLDEYLRGKPRGEASKLAKAVGVYSSSITQYIKGTTRPTPDTAAKIQLATGGEVTIAELLYPDGLPAGIESIGGPSHPVQQNVFGESERTDTSDAVWTVFDYWRRRTGRKHSRLVGKRREKIRARLREGYTVEDLKEAIDGMMGSPYHQGENPRHVKYDDIELVCRDGVKVERFIQIAEQRRREVVRDAVDREQGVSISDKLLK